MALPAASYQPRRPQDSDYYHCVEDYFETFVQEYDDRFARQYGFWRLKSFGIGQISPRELFHPRQS
jgi:hypothetical protein